LGLLVADGLLITGPLPAATNHSSDLVPGPPPFPTTAAADKTLMPAAVSHNIKLK